MLINFEECIINHSSIQLRKYGILNGSLLSSPQRRRTALPPLLYSLSTNFLKREEFSHAYAQLQSITHFADVWTNSLVRILNTIASYHSYSSCSLLSSFPALSHTRPQCTNGMNFKTTVVPFFLSASYTWKVSHASRLVRLLTSLPPGSQQR